MATCIISATLDISGNEFSRIVHHQTSLSIVLQVSSIQNIARLITNISIGMIPFQGSHLHLHIENEMSPCSVQELDQFGSEIFV